MNKVILTIAYMPVYMINCAIENNSRTSENPNNSELHAVVSFILK